MSASLGSWERLEGNTQGGPFGDFKGLHFPNQMKTRPDPADAPRSLMVKLGIAP